MPQSLLRFAFAFITLLAFAAPTFAVPNGQSAPVSDASGLTITGAGSDLPRTAAARSADETNALDFTTFAAAAARAASAGKVLKLPPGSYSYTGGTTLTISAPVLFEPGAVLTCSGANVAFTGLLSAPRSQIFSAACTPAITAVNDAIYPEWWGAKADATYNVIGSGTDNTAPFATALSYTYRKVSLAAGNYRFASPVPLASGVNMECAGRDSTHLLFDDPSGTADALTVGVSTAATHVSVKHCGLDRMQAATAGALVHVHSTWYVHMDDNRIGSYQNANSFDNVKVDCDAANSAEIYFNNNAITGAVNDDLKLTCRSQTYTIADVFVENRNYFSNALHAVELDGSVGWTHFDNNDFDTGTSGSWMILQDSTTGKSGAAFNISVHNNHFENNAYAMNFTGAAGLTITGNEILSYGKIICTLCQWSASSSNIMQGASLELYGVSGWSDSNSTWFSSAGMTSIVKVGPSGTSASSGVTFSGETFYFSYIPFVEFTGSAYPATNVSINVNTVQGSCWTGDNVDLTTLNYNCQGAGSGSAGVTSQGLFTSTNPGASGLQSNLFWKSGWKYFANGTAGAIEFNYDFSATGTKHAMEFVVAANNASGASAAASPVLSGYLDQSGNQIWIKPTYVSSLIARGGAPSLSGSCGANTQVGGNNAGSFKAAAACAVGANITIGFWPYAPSGWVCDLHDMTTPAAQLNQTATNTSSATFTLAGSSVAANDAIVFKCQGF